MDIHVYNKAGNITMIHNVPAACAEAMFTEGIKAILNDPFCRYYRITLFDPMRNTEVKDSDGPIFTMDINLGLR